jgi:hypothetical protein
LIYSCIFDHGGRLWLPITQTPPEIFCYNRKQTKPLPSSVPDSQSKFTASYSEETVLGNTITYLKDIHYDSIVNMVKVELRDYSEQASPFYVTDPLLAIHDYNIGVSFTINEAIGNCSITPLTNSSFDSDSSFTASLMATNNSYVVRIKSPQALLQLDTPYVYTGRGRVNGVPVDRYVSDRSAFFDGQPLFAEYTFAADDFDFDNGKAKNSPLTLVLNGPTPLSQVCFCFKQQQQQQQQHQQKLQSI